MDITSLTNQLDAAMLGASPVQALDGELSVDSAYRIQRSLLQRRVDRGEEVIGLKLGFTSAAKRQQLGVADVICGQLTDAMWAPTGGEVDLCARIHPRVEPEVALLLGNRPARGAWPGRARLGIAAVAPAMEIIDSRYEDFRFSLPAVIADNASASAFVVGRWQEVHQDLRNLGVVLEINGRPVQVGSSAAILGNPTLALVEAERLAGAANIALGPGSVVLAGAATAAVPLSTGSYVRAELEALGEVSFTTCARTDSCYPIRTGAP